MLAYWARPDPSGIIGPTRRRGWRARNIVAIAIVGISLPLAGCSGGSGGGGAGGTTATTTPSATQPGSGTTPGGGSTAITAGRTTDGEPPATAAAASEELDANEARAALNGFALSQGVSESAVYDHRSDVALVAAAGAALAASISGDGLWAATYVWVNEGDLADPLLPLLEHPDPSIRIMAATGVIARGRTEGFAPLVDAPTDETILADQDPPSPAWLVATRSLVRFTGIGELGPPFDATAGQRAEAKTRWDSWLADHLDDLTFDQAEVWRTA